MSPSVPIIPPYEPETGITQSPTRTFQRRPAMGQLADEEAAIEGHYLAKASKIVAILWPNYSAGAIAKAVRDRTNCPGFNVRMVYAIKARLDRMKRPGA